MKVLVTGGSGSFGRAYIARVLQSQSLRRIVCLSRDEAKQEDLKREIPDRRFECWLGDVRDYERLVWAMRAGFDLVVHAAALKRVKACEANPEEAFKTNVDGTRNVAKVAVLAGVGRVLLLSTDKASSPCTTYGRTKAAAEAVFVGMNQWVGSAGTKLSCVRYGNVVASRGSVIPLFLEQRRSGVIRITDERMTRFWLSMEDAVSFVELALDRMQGGEIFIPKIASARVKDLAKAMAPNAVVETIGLRAGEKIHEVLIAPDEAHQALDLGDCYALVSTWAKAWDASKLVPEGFRYSSADDPLPVQWLEGVTV